MFSLKKTPVKADKPTHKFDGYLSDQKVDTAKAADLARGGALDGMTIEEIDKRYLSLEKLEQRYNITRKHVRQLRWATAISIFAILVSGLLGAFIFRNQLSSIASLIAGGFESISADVTDRLESKRTFKEITVEDKTYTKELVASGDSDMEGSLSVGGDISGTKNLNIQGSVTIGENLNVAGVITLPKGLIVTANSSFNSVDIDDLTVNKSLKSLGSNTFGSSIFNQGFTAKSQGKFSGGSSGSAVSQGLVYLNADSAGDNDTLFGVAIGGNQKLRLSGNGSLAISGDLNVSGTTALIGLSTSGNTTVGSSLTVVGNTDIGSTLSVNGAVTLQSNLTIGDTSSDKLTIKATLDSHLIPTSNDTKDLGSAGAYFSRVYADEIIANNIAGSTSAGGTNSSSFSINQDAASDEDSSLVFYRGAGNINATLSWDSGLDILKINQNLQFENETPSAGTQLTLKASSAQGSTDILKVVDSLSTSLLTINPSGDLSLLNSNPTIKIAGNNTLTFADAGNSIMTLQDFAGVANAGLLTTGIIETVLGATNQAIFRSSTNSTVGYGYSGNDLRLYANSTTPRILVQGSNGNVGIGTLTLNSPYGHTARLTVDQNQTYPHTGIRITGGSAITDVGIALDNRNVTGGRTYHLVSTGGGSIPSNSFSIIDQNAGGLHRFTINSNGDVGIGATSPNAKLDVVGSAYLSGIMCRGSTGGCLSGGYVRFIDSGNAAQPVFTFGDDNNTGMYGGGADTLVFSTGGVERLRINPSGNIGIANTNPGAKLQVGGNIRISTNFGIELFNHTSTSLFYAPYFDSGGGANNGNIIIGRRGTGTDLLNSVQFRTGNDSERMRIDVNGNVGIGETNPGTRLHVTGSTADANSLVTIQNSGDSGEFLYATNDLGNTVIELNQKTSGDGHLTINKADGSQAIVFDSTFTSYVNTGANFGFGRNDPTYDVDVLDASSEASVRIESDASHAVLRIDSASSFDPKIYFNTGNNTRWAVGVDDSDSDKLIFGTDQILPTSPKIAFTTDARIGIGTTTPNESLDVEGNVEIDASVTTYTQRLCHSGANGATDNLKLGDCASAGQADFAEYYGSSQKLLAGTIVAIDPNRPAETFENILGQKTSKAWVVAAKPGLQAIGIVSTAPFAEVLAEDVFEDSENPVPIALNGRVPVRVTAENGAINSGDPITLSSKEGVGVKAREGDRVVGFALNSFDGKGEGEVLAFVNAFGDESRVENHGRQNESSQNIMQTVIISGAVAVVAVAINNKIGKRKS